VSEREIQAPEYMPVGGIHERARDPGARVHASRPRGAMAAAACAAPTGGRATANLAPHSAARGTGRARGPGEAALKITMLIPIECGATTCSSGLGECCRHRGSIRLGQTPVCRLFPDDRGAHTLLREDHPGGWVLRCPACLAAERGAAVNSAFISAPFNRCREAADARDNLVAAGIVVRTRWIDQAIARGGHDRLTSESAAQAIAENDADLRAADVCVALCYPPEGCEMWGEIARALEWGKPVYLVCGSARPLVAYRRGVVLCASVGDAIEAM